MRRMLSPVVCEQSPDAGTRDRTPLVEFVGGLDNPTSSGRRPARRGGASWNHPRFCPASMVGCSSGLMAA